MTKKAATVDAVLGALFTAYRQRVDVLLDVYSAGLTDIPTPLLSSAIGLAVRTRKFFPTVAELREDAEACRKDLSDAKVYVPCEASCSETPGWLTTVDANNIERMTRCHCWVDHQARLRAGGVPAKPVLALVRGRQDDES